MSENYSDDVNRFTRFRHTGDNRISPQETKRQVDCYEQLLFPLDAGSMIADLGCGDGRLAFPLSKSYRHIVGIDIDHDLLRTAERIRSLRYPNTSFVNADMRSLPFNAGTFDGAIDGFSSWGFYGVNDDRRSLRQIARTLRPEGVFVLDYGNINYHLREIEEIGVYDEELAQRVIIETLHAPDGADVIRKSWVDTSLCYHWQCQRVGESEPLVIGAQQGYQPNELASMLIAARLQPSSIYGTYDFDEVSSTNSRLIVRAVKQ
jgi:ubiquinone/menaquinone biosynthesis C-methylase UbiE